MRACHSGGAVMIRRLPEAADLRPRSASVASAPPDWKLAPLMSTFCCASALPATSAEARTSFLNMTTLRIGIRNRVRTRPARRAVGEPTRLPQGVGCLLRADHGTTATPRDMNRPTVGATAVNQHVPDD